MGTFLAFPKKSEPSDLREKFEPSDLWPSGKMWALRPPALQKILSLPTSGPPPSGKKSVLWPSRGPISAHLFSIEYWKLSIYFWPSDFRRPEKSEPSDHRLSTLRENFVPSDIRPSSLRKKLSPLTSEKKSALQKDGGPEVGGPSTHLWCKKINMICFFVSCHRNSHTAQFFNGINILFGIHFQGVWFKVSGILYLYFNISFDSLTIPEKIMLKLSSSYLDMLWRNCWISPNFPSSQVKLFTSL